ncbi:hypothetical protein ACGFNV_27945 [Streptomyces sp. NPDC048751]|uniref:hypothetical protein n=1 Tax=Streptomyces sp. NPDC048751 TaxID=3365591 RepID=UPI00371C0F7D
MTDVTPDEGRRRTPEPGAKGIPGERTGESTDERRVPGAGTHTPGGLGAGAEDVSGTGATGAGPRGTPVGKESPGIPEEHGTPMGGKSLSGAGLAKEDTFKTTGRAASTPSHEAASTPSHEEEARLLSHDEADKLALQLHHAVSGFVDGPKGAVEEADHVLEEIASRFTEAVTRRRRTLRGAWQSTEGGEGKPTTTTDTEQLRLALRDYRELAERLLRV